MKKKTAHIKLMPEFVMEVDDDDFDTDDPREWAKFIAEWFRLHSIIKIDDVEIIPKRVNVKLERIFTK